MFFEVKIEEIEEIACFQAGCMPYPFPPCEHHNTQTKFDNCDNEPDFKTPTCTKARRNLIEIQTDEESE